MRVVEHWSKQVMEAPSLAISETQLNMALSNLLYLTLDPEQRWLNRKFPEIPSYLNNSEML